MGQNVGFLAASPIHPVSKERSFDLGTPLSFHSNSIRRFGSNAQTSFNDVFPLFLRSPVDLFTKI